MNTAQFITYLDAAGVDTSLATSRPVLFERLAQSWRWTHKCCKTLDLAFIGDLDGRPITNREALSLRQLSALHTTFRASLNRRAPAELLRKISEDRVSALMRDQMPVTASMSTMLKEAQSMIASDNLALLGFLRSNAIDLNQKDRDGLTSCAIAAQSGSDKCLFALCKNGANPHIGDAMGNTPLHWACAMGQPKAVSVLLYHGANPNAVSDNGVTPLMLALSKSNVELAQKLLEYGADLRMIDRKGNTVLHRAVLAKNFATAQFLLESGASMEEPNLDGSTALGLAMRVPEFGVLFLHEQSRSERRQGTLV